MKRASSWLVIVNLVVMFAGCESTEPGNTQVSGGYYGVAYYDPWYYGESYCPPDDTVRPPPDRPIAPRPEQPIANPPGSSVGGPRPMPTIPSMPRPSFRR